MRWLIRERIQLTDTTNVLSTWLLFVLAKKYCIS
jgi:hypothetical protein